MKFKPKYLLLFIFSLIFIFQFIYAGDLTSKEQATLCLEESKVILYEMVAENFSHQRIEDNLNKAQNLYYAQILLEKDGKNYDFSLIPPYCEEIQQIRSFAIKSIDEYSALKRFYEISINSEMNSSELDNLIREIETEMNNERYERIPDLIDKAYNEISIVRSSYTSLNLFYNSTARGLKNFFIKNWKIITIILLILLILFFIFYKRVRIILLENKIKELELRRITIQELIKQTQLNYFQKGIMSEGNYNLRTKKFAEFVRDIDRQLPMLKETILKLKKDKFKKDIIEKKLINEIISEEDNIERRKFIKNTDSLKVEKNISLEKKNNKSNKYKYGLFNEEHIKNIKLNREDIGKIKK